MGSITVENTGIQRDKPIDLGSICVFSLGQSEVHLVGALALTDVSQLVSPRLVQDLLYEHRQVIV